MLVKLALLAVACGVMFSPCAGLTEDRYIADSSKGNIYEQVN